MVELFVGTAGFSYSHWKYTLESSKVGSFFYPPHCPKDKELCHYSSVFNAVEINTSFYGIPQVKSLLSWKNQVMQSTPLLLDTSRSNEKNKNGNDELEISTDFQFTFKMLQTVSHQLLPSITRGLDTLMNINDLKEN